MGDDRGGGGDFRDSLERLLRRLDRDGRLTEARAAELWAQVAGPRIAGHTRATGVRGGTLLVEVDSNAWATELTAMSAEFTAAVNEQAGKILISGARFTVSKRVAEERRREGTAAATRAAIRDSVEPAELDEVEIAFVEESVAGIPDERLREAARRAMRADLAWKKGRVRADLEDGRDRPGQSPQDT